MPDTAFAQFDFDLGQAVIEQLLAHFNSLAIGPLKTNVLRQMRDEPGVYQLFLERELVYVGKADRNVRKRLKDHLWKLSGRLNLNPDDLGFKALYIHRNWAPSVHESILINEYRRRGESEWNASGFGNNDPGRRRDHTDTESSHFDSRFPIDPDYAPGNVDGRAYKALELLLLLKKELPYIFRFETRNRKNYRAGSPKYNTLDVTIARDGMTTRHLLQQVVEAFPVGWQATFLPGRLILYEESVEYPHAIAVIRRRP